MTESAVHVQTAQREAFAALDRPTLVGRLRLGVELLDPRLFQMEPEGLDRVWDPAEGVGTWSCRALVAHLMDAELVYGYRIRRTLAEDGPVLENFDEHAFIASPLYGAPRPDGSAIVTPMGAMAASIHALRMTLGAVLYQLDDDEWDRRAMHPLDGPVTVHDLVVTHAWHLEHHAVYANAKVEKLLGPLPEGWAEGAQNGAACSPGGCGAGCGCVGPADDTESTN